MASRYSVSTPKVSTGALTAGSAKSLILLNPATDGFVITELWLSFGATAGQTDIAAELYRTTTVGTPSGTTATIVKDDPNTATSTVSGLYDLSEPTAVERLRSFYLSTAGGLVIVEFPLGREVVAAPVGQRIGVRIINDGSSTMTAVDTRATLVFEEQ